MLKSRAAGDARKDRKKDAKTADVKKRQNPEKAKKQSPDKIKKQSPDKTKQRATKTNGKAPEVVINGSAVKPGAVKPGDVAVVDNSIEDQIEKAKYSLHLEELGREARLKDRLQYLEAMKAQKEQVAERWPGKSFEVGLRLDWFVGLKEFLIRDEDPCQVLTNVDAIMEAYKKGTLTWAPGYVTYWSHGEQLTELREFDWEEFLCWNTKHKGGEGFWVEGLRNSHPTRRFWKHTQAFPGKWNPPKGSGIDPKNFILNEYAARVKLPILLRLIRRPAGYDPKLDPNSTLDPKRPMRNNPPDWYNRPVPREPLPPVWNSKLEKLDKVETREGVTSNIKASDQKFGAQFFWMDDDTGCDVCTIMESDVKQLMRAAETGLKAEEIAMPEGVFPPPLLGYVSFKDSGGMTRYQPVRAMEINLMGETHLHLKGEWDIIEVAIAPDQDFPDLPIRLLGPWLRHRFFTATAPDSTGRLWVLNKGHRLRELPWSNTHLMFTGMLPGLSLIPSIPDEADDLLD